MRTVKVRILPPQPTLLILLKLFYSFLTRRRFLTIEVNLFADSTLPHVLYLPSGSRSAGTPLFHELRESDTSLRRSQGVLTLSRCGCNAFHAARSDISLTGPNDSRRSFRANVPL